MIWFRAVLYCDLINWRDKNTDCPKCYQEFDDDLKEISVTMYHISKRRMDLKIRKDADMKRAKESDAGE